MNVRSVFTFTTPEKHFLPSATLSSSRQNLMHESRSRGRLSKCLKGFQNHPKENVLRHRLEAFDS